ncbi:MAG: hypothetical protein ACRD39_01495, partial [Nitrososphaeraceae archaeon]
MTSFIASRLHVGQLAIIITTTTAAAYLYPIVLAGPVGFDPTTTGFGGLRSFFLKEQHPILT